MRDKGPSSVRRAAPVAESQSLIVLSPDADATSLPSGKNATPLTQPEWPSSMRRAAPVAESQSLTVLSPDADATSLPSGENATPNSHTAVATELLRASEFRNRTTIESCLFSSFQLTNRPEMVSRNRLDLKLRYKQWLRLANVREIYQHLVRSKLCGTYN